MQIIFLLFALVIKPLQEGARAPSTPKCIALFHGLQNVIAPDTFNPRMIYDGKKLAYCKLGKMKGTTVSAYRGGRLERCSLTFPPSLTSSSPGAISLSLCPTHLLNPEGCFKLP